MPKKECMPVNHCTVRTLGLGRLQLMCWFALHEIGGNSSDCVKVICQVIFGNSKIRVSLHRIQMMLVTTTLNDRIEALFTRSS